MQCPTCEHQSPIQHVECPGCHEQFAGDDLDELAHIDYLQDRVIEWEDDRLLPRRLATRLLEITGEDRTAIRDRLTRVRREGGRIPVGSETGKLRIPGQPGLAPSQPHAAAAATMPPVPTFVGGAAYPARSAACPAHTSPVATGIRAHVAPVRTHPLARSITASLAAQPVAPSPPRPQRPAFSWKQVGTYLLSERTLNGLLGLGVLLILAAAFVISTLNPTGLPPLARLAAMLATTAVFYGAGYLVEARLHLFRAGAALLTIGASLIPFSIWTLGQQDLLGWDRSTTWLIASALCLPVYLGSHLLLRDRIFALLSAITGGSLVLAVLHTLGLPIEWGLCALVGLAIVYQVAARRLPATRQPLARALFWTAQVTTPAVLLGLLAIKLLPQLWDLSLSGQVYLAGTPSASFEYAVGTAWWLGVGFYAVASLLTGRRVYAYATAWLLPCAALLTLTKAPFAAAWYDLCLALLAASYLLFGRFVADQTTGAGAATPAPTLARLLRRPTFGAGLALTVLAACWPLASSASLAATLYALCGVYWLAAALLRQPAARAAARAVAVYLLPLALGVSFGAAGAITWLNLAYVALAAAYLLAGRFLLAARRPYSYAALAREPLFQAAGLLALLAAAWPVFAPASHDLTTFALILTAALATVTLEQRAWAYVTVYIWFFTTGCAFVATRVLALSTGITTIHIRTTDDTQALLWTGTAAAALVAAELLVRRTGESRRTLPGTVIGLGVWRSRFASPLFSLCYLSTLVAIGLSLSSFSTAGDVPTAPALAALILVVAIYGLSAATRRSSVFLYAASLLATVPFVALAGQLITGHSGLLLPMPEQARLLAVLSLCYLALGHKLDRAPGHYAKPLYLAAYLLLVGTIAEAAPDTASEMQVLGLALLGFAWSAWLVYRDRHPAFSWLLERLQFRSDDATGASGARALFVYITAWLFPIWLCLAGYSLAGILHRPAPADDAYGLGLVALSIGYLALGLRIRHIRAEYRWPFYIATYAMDAWGLALLTDQGPDAALLGYGLSVMLYGASARIFRHSTFAWPLALTLSITYALALAVSPLGTPFHGAALLPGLLATLAIATRLRRLDAVADDAQAHRRVARAGRWLRSWASPFYLALHVGCVGVLVLVPASATLYAASLWALVALYGVAARRIGYPLAGVPRWLYPAAAIGVQAYGVSLDAALSMIRGHGLTAAGLVVAGIVPATVLLALAEVVGDRDGQAAALPLGVDRSWATQRVPGWARPLLVIGLATVALSTLGALTLNDPLPGLLVGGTYCAVFIVLANRWASQVPPPPRRIPIAAWTALGFSAIAVQEGLRFAGVSAVEQPVGWAMGALVATCFSLWARGTRHPLRSPAAPKGLWAGPLFYGSLAVGTLALLSAASNQSSTATDQTLHSLSLVVALTGLGLIAHGLIRRNRRLSYGGVALLLAGYMLQLIHFGVGQPQAFVLPTGVYLLVVAFLEWRRGTAAGVKGLLELAALALLLGTTFLQATGMLTGGLNHMAYDLFLLGEGLVVVGAGAMLRWRMPFFAGAGAVVVAVALLLADPLRAAASWYLLFLLGAALIGLVVFLEQKRQQIPLWIDDVRLRLEAWS